MRRPSLTHRWIVLLETLNPMPVSHFDSSPAVPRYPLDLTILTVSALSSVRSIRRPHPQYAYRLSAGAYTFSPARRAPSGQRARLARYEHPPHGPPRAHARTLRTARRPGTPSRSASANPASISEVVADDDGLNPDSRHRLIAYSRISPSRSKRGRRQRQRGPRHATETGRPAAAAGWPCGRPPPAGPEGAA